VIVTFSDTEASVKALRDAFSEDLNKVFGCISKILGTPIVTQLCLCSIDQLPPAHFDVYTCGSGIELSYRLDTLEVVRTVKSSRTETSSSGPGDRELPNFGLLIASSLGSISPQRRPSRLPSLVRHCRPSYSGSSISISSRLAAIAKILSALAKGEQGGSWKQQRRWRLRNTVDV
jgi:hypothetical protein